MGLQYSAQGGTRVVNSRHFMKLPRVNGILHNSFQQLLHKECTSHQGWGIRHTTGPSHRQALSGTLVWYEMAITFRKCSKFFFNSSSPDSSLRHTLFKQKQWQKQYWTFTLICDEICLLKEKGNWVYQDEKVYTMGNRKTLTDKRCPQR